MAFSTRSTVIPCLMYRDAGAAIDWLSRVFGLSVKMSIPGPDGSIAHAELVWEGGMLMVGTVNDGPCGKYMTQPDAIGGLETQTIYLVVPDADAVYERVQAAGAEILNPIKDESYGGRGFTCRDLEGHMWNVGSYNPWI